MGGDLQFYYQGIAEGAERTVKENLLEMINKYIEGFK